MKVLVALSLYLFCNSLLFAQSDSGGVSDLRNRVGTITEAKKKIELESPDLKSTSELFEEINNLNQTVLELSIDTKANGQAIKQKEEEINALKLQLDLAAQKEQKIVDLNVALSKAAEELLNLQKYKTKTEREKFVVDSLLVVTNAQNEENVRFQITKFIGIVEGWSTLSGNYEALAVTAEAVLIFDDGFGKKIVSFLKNEGIDMSTLGLGAASLNGFQDKKKEAGYGFAALVVGLKTLQSLLKNSKEFEGVTRNVAFADEIRTYAKLATPLDSTVVQLSRDIPTTDNEQKKWLPERKHIDSYQKIINLMNQIYFQNILIKNKAKYLVDEMGKNMSPKGKSYLEKVVNSHTKAIETWDKVQPLHNARIRLLNDDLLKREEKQQSVK